MKFYIAGTPIGNLDDVSARLLNVLEEADIVVAEDTRKVKNLFSFFSMPVDEKEVYSFHEASDKSKVDKIIEELKQSDVGVYVSGAGTPGVSDPGAYLVERIRKELPMFDIFPVPGPSAVTAALSVSGFNADQFSFWGFIPKKEKEDFFERVKKSDLMPAVMFDSKHRIINSLEVAEEVFGGRVKCFVGREMSKKYETHYLGSIPVVKEAIDEDPKKGEYTLVFDYVD